MLSGVYRPAQSVKLEPSSGLVHVPGSERDPPLHGPRARQKSGAPMNRLTTQETVYVTSVVATPGTC